LFGIPGSPENSAIQVFPGLIRETTAKITLKRCLTINIVSATVLVGLATWTLFLLILMEALRSRPILMKAVAANELKPDNSNLSPFMQRLARAHANCVESLPVFGTLLIVALLTNRAGDTNPLAPWLFAARLIQSCAHLASLSLPAVWVRFIAFAFQIAIAVYWLSALLLG
jgi:uncharacterized MAPEG superfamily protein